MARAENGDLKEEADEGEMCPSDPYLPDFLPGDRGIDVFLQI